MVNVTASVVGEDEGVGQFIGEVNRQIAYQRTVQLNRANLNAKKRAEKQEEDKQEEGKQE